MDRGCGSRSSRARRSSSTTCSRLAAALRARTPEETPVARCDLLKPSLDAYLGRPPIEELQGDVAIAEWAVDPRPGVLLISSLRWSRLRGLEMVPDLPIFAQESGFDFGKGRRLDILVLSHPWAFDPR
ncbi:MAG: hypothetical protein NTY35_01200 [Planctomycetota bacterium]|nr:hypothetical protein [Planctomycetota bacterium]